MSEPSRRVVTFAPTDPRLGRHHVHDPRSRGYALVVHAPPTRSVMHTRHNAVWDQGEVGSCTANAALALLVTGSAWDGHTVYTERDAVALYSAETRLDDREIPGHYPPDDTGSAGLYSMAALKAQGKIASYWHAFSTLAVLTELAQRPVSIGIPWYESMFEPDPRTGQLTVDRRSGIAGGHQVPLDGVDPARLRVRLTNSWGTGWGIAGTAWLSYDDLSFLLSQGGDAVSVRLPAR